MSSTVLALHFIRCPKCLKVIREPSEVSLYGCGGCGAILRAKVHSDSGDTLSLASAASSSKNILYSGSFENEKTSFGKQVLSDSDSSGHQGHVVEGGPDVSGSSGERIIKVEFSGNEIKNHAQSKSNSGSLIEEMIYRVVEQNEISSLEEKQLPTKSENSLNEKGQESSNQEILYANDSLSSSDKVEESSESHDPDTISEDGEVNGKMRNDKSFILKRSSSHAYEGSASSTDKTISRFNYQAREQGISFPSEDFHSALNFIGSGNDATSNSQSKDAKQSIKFRHTEKTVQVKILRKVDELRNELRILFNRAADGKGASRLESSAQFKGEVSPNRCRSLHSHNAGICCHDEHGRRCHHNVCCPLPESTVSRQTLHMKHSPPLHQQPQTQKSNDKRLQEVKRHCRPVSGGAPFVICYRCYNLLQLPADFLVSTKSVHKLRCGSCSEVLRYTFRPRTHMTAWTPAEVQLPPSEDDKGHIEVLDDEITARHGNYLREAGPVSYSEEYGPSFGKSNSYEAEPSLLLRRNCGTIIEEEHGGIKSSGSKLHKLMGYSSARYLIYETLSTADGNRTEHDR